LTPAAPDILARIVSRKREELRASTVPAAGLRQLAQSLRPGRRNFTAALRSKWHSNRPAIIAEIKKASPSRGILVNDFCPVELAKQYELGGAAALSVLTDRDFFEGSLDDLRNARAACNLPVIRKDFTISEYHVLEAAAAGADAILLIVAILDESRLHSFRELAREFEMAALVEVHDARELEIALRSDAEIIGVNNRDLRTFDVSLETSVSLAPQIPGTVTKVSESGIFSSADIQRLLDAGYDACLVGEHLVKSGNPTVALQALCS
jgi:indole-3-glycerol phosphate synthase